MFKKFSLQMQKKKHPKQQFITISFDFQYFM